MITWWQLELAANLVISVAYLCIAGLIVVPLARLHQLKTNKLGVATAAIFFSCSLGHFMHFVQPVLLGSQDTASMGGGWSAGIHAATACVAVYYLSLRRFYGRLLQAPMFDDLAERQRVVELEAFRVEAAARAEAEAERDFSVALLQSINRHSQSLIYVKDLEGRFLMANAAFQKTFHLAEADLLGQTFDVVDPSTHGLWAARDLEAHAGPTHQEGRIVLPDGEHIFETAKFPVFDARGDLYATCGISLDVTQQRTANRTLAEARDEALAANAALGRARDEAIAATVAKSTFLATMSHEIRTPLNAVIGMTDLLLDTRVDHQQHEFLETVRSSGDALLAVINDILDFSRIESGELLLVSTSFHLRDAVERCLDLVAAQATERGLELVCHLDDSCPELVVGDADRIRQILLNLLSNAVKFTEQGEVLLTVTVLPTHDGRLTVTARVTDTGIGISAAGLPMLFRSFSQVDASSTRAHGGTGLGLTISQRLARAMGGDVSVTSVLGQGSTFTATVVVDPSSRTGIGPTSASDVVLSGLSVLAVDDNPTNLRILRLQLTDAGMVCTTVDTPAAALALAHAGSAYDVAVIDMNMPDMNGVQLGAALRRTPSMSRTPLVLLTSAGTSAPRSSTDFVSSVSKPVKRSALCQALAAAINNGPGSAGPRRTLRSPDPRVDHPLRVLLAEDNLVNQRVAQLMLDRLGHRVEIVDNGRAAVEAITRGGYDVVLMDVQMPEMDGLEATRTIRAQLPAEQQPYIIALTANAMVEDRQACLSAGMEDYLSKPVRGQELGRMLTRVSATIRPRA